ncbi:MAG: thiamine biosynthesis protein ApbE, partial [Gammaproteobacteria bacterium]
NWLIDNIELARQVSDATNGLFDISIGPIAAYWGFGHLPPPNKVSQKAIDSLLQYVGYQKMSIQNNRLIKEVSELQLNCNAIAQGYAVDVVSHFLLAQGMHYLG